MTTALDVKSFFQSKGYSAVVSNALAGNAVAESNLNPNAVGDNGTAFGIFQWRGSRKKALDLYAARKGKSWNDPQTQLEFADYELRTTERGTYSALQKATTTRDAVNSVLGYLRPQGYSRTNPTNSMNYDERLSYSEQLAGSSGNDTLDVEEKSLGASIIDGLFQFMSGVSGVSPMDGGVMPDQSITSGEYGTDTIYDTLKVVAAPLAIGLIVVLLFIVGIMSLLPKPQIPKGS